MPIIDRDDVKDAGEIKTTARDDRINFLIGEVQAEAESFCQRKFDRATYTEHFDTAGSQGFVLVANPPIISITSVTDDAQVSARAIDVSANVRDEQEYYDRGEVRLWNAESVFTNGDAAVNVVYVGGYDRQNLPKDLKGALVNEVLFRLNNPNRWGVKSESADGVNVAYDMDGNFAAQTAAVLKRYRQWWRDIA